MFETVADHAAGYRRRIAEILGRILGRASPAELGHVEKRDRTMAMVLRLAILLLVAGCLAYGIWRGTSTPSSSFPAPAGLSNESIDLGCAYQRDEGHYSLRGQRFLALAQSLSQSVSEGKLELSAAGVGDLLGPPDHVGEGLPLVWQYRCGLWPSTGVTVKVVFKGDRVERFEFCEPAPVAAKEDSLVGTPGLPPPPAMADFTLSACLRDYLMREGHAHRGPYFLTLAQVLDEAARGNTLALTRWQAEDMFGKPDRIEEGPPPQWTYFYADHAGNKDWAVTLSFEEDKVKEFRFEKRPKAGDIISPP